LSIVSFYNCNCLVYFFVNCGNLIISSNDEDFKRLQKGCHFNP
ncbi:MAG: hypothetical protein ACI9Q3_000083, partial [Maribacter sp.]